MKIPNRVDGPLCGAVLAKCPSATWRKAAPGRRTLCTAKDVPQDAYRSRSGRNFFCSRSSLWLTSTFLPASESRRSASIHRARDIPQTYSTTAIATAKPLPRHSRPQQVQNRELLLSYVPQEDAGTVEQYFNYHRDPYRRGYAQSDGPRLQISEVKDDVSYPQKDEVYHGSDEVKQTVAKLCHAVGVRLRYPHRATLDSIYKLYCQLPEPRMLNLTGQWRGKLLRVMGTPHKRENESMLRYFVMVSDVKNAGLTLRRAQWNHALSFATKYTSRVGLQEMDSGLRLWRQMEREANVKGNDITFNILFDVAAKAGNFALAEMIYKEMDARGIEFNRFHHVSLMYFFGLKLDSGGIRAAYREMVESGEMIDTVALNAVISGFLRCGEEAAAEETYQRMMSGSPRAVVMPERNYMMGKVVTKVMMMFSKVSKEHPQLNKSLQTNVQLVPDIRTFRLLVEHYAIKMGDLAKVARYLDEMKFLNIPVHPTIFLALFKGFYVHGERKRSEWSFQRLNNVLSALYEARDGNARGFRIDTWMVIWALRAVRKCSTPDEAVRTFDEMAQRWDIPAERHVFIHGLLENIVRNKDLKTARHNSVGTLHRA